MFDMFVRKIQQSRPEKREPLDFAQHDSGFLVAARANQARMARLYLNHRGSPAPR